MNRRNATLTGWLETMALATTADGGSTFDHFSGAAIAKTVTVNGDSNSHYDGRKPRAGRTVA